VGVHAVGAVAEERCKAVTVKAADVPNALDMKRGGAKSYEVPKKTLLPGAQKKAKG
jgi:hypothetical protein